MKSEDPEYVAARRVLLNALDALGTQRSAVVLVGAQAIYLRVGDAGIPGSLRTTDGDLGLRPELLTREPELSACMTKANFHLDPREPVGIWVTETDIGGRMAEVKVDLLVPDAVGGVGSRAARIPPHAKSTARKVRGLEGVLFDHDMMSLPSLEATDTRSHKILVAGPAALIVAKSHKIMERLAEGKRLGPLPKDALDVVRLLRGCPEDEVVDRTKRLIAFDGSQVAAEQATAVVTREAWDFLRTEFGVLAGRGCDLAV